MFCNIGKAATHTAYLISMLVAWSSLSYITYLYMLKRKYISSTNVVGLRH